MQSSGFQSQLRLPLNATFPPVMPLLRAIVSGYRALRPDADDPRSVKTPSWGLLTHVGHTGPKMTRLAILVWRICQGENKWL
jgi:hypothetical protein